jgi:hypothetical protein
MLYCLGGANAQYPPPTYCDNGTQAREAEKSVHITDPLTRE